MIHSALAELASLKAPDGKWDASLEKVDSIVVSLIESPVQNYTELVKDISSEDLETYAKQGLALWCKNTKDHYDEKTRSITNADTWNANYGLLVKIRWAVWLLLIKEKTVAPESLQSYVDLRRFDRGNFNSVDGTLGWYEYFVSANPLPTLTNPNINCCLLRPWFGKKIGNVRFAIRSLTGDLPLESPPAQYERLREGMLKIATDAMTSCMSYIKND